MSREVDIKALISHIVRGDGADKCRICMGDTSEGQVSLGDTVMMDGDRPVTLAELLEVITGVEVQIDDELPNGLCSFCSGSAIDAANFTVLCRQVHNKWKTTLLLLEAVPLPKNVSLNTKSIYAIVQDDKLTIVDEKKSESAKEPIKQTPLTPIHKQPTSLLKHKIKNKRRSGTLCPCQCPTCGKKFQYAHLLSLHLKESCDLLRACHICAQVMSREDLIKHMYLAHQTKPLLCKKCPAMFHLRMKYIKHVQTAHASGVCTCGECGRVFKSRYGFNAHQTVHIPKTCPACDELFRNQSCYRYHLTVCCNIGKTKRRLHVTKNRVTIEVKNRISMKKVRVGLLGGNAQNECICDYCGKKFLGRKFIMAHIQHVHMKNTHRPCPYCGKSLAAAHMTEHIKTHELVREYKCDHCNLVLKTRLGFIQHLRLHTGEKPYACNQCGQSFSASSRRSEHMKKFHNTDVLYKHPCDMCTAKFILPSQLKKHKASVHSISSGHAFECEVCHEKFGSCRGLIHHSRKHQKDVDHTLVPKRTSVNLMFE